ncbi:MAG TPA: D-glycerate dehydrogenase [Acidobacteriota bacterium]|jgi:glyoxylate reductase
MPGSAPRVFVTTDIGAEALERLRRQGYKLEVYPEIEPPPRHLVLERVRSGIEAIITTLRDSVDQELLAAGRDTLRVVANVAVGFDNIDRAAANSAKIPFTNTADVLTEATAEFGLFLMGCVSRKLYPSEKLVEENRWGVWHPNYPFLSDEVTGKTVSVIGAGRIGKAFARKCIGLDMEILLYSPRSRDQQFLDFAQREMDLRFEAGFCRKPHRIFYVPLEDAFRRADYVSLHIPLIKAGDNPTYHMINESLLGLMKPTAYLINTARGPVVDEQALYRALVENRIGGAALDVFEVEPLPADSRLRDPVLKDRLRMFHHFASGTKETRLSSDPDVGMAGRAVQAVIDVLENRYGGDPSRMPYVVNKEAFR